MIKTRRMLTICLSLLLVLIVAVSMDAKAATKVSLNKTKATLYVGETTTLKLKGAKVKKWRSSDKTVATVNKNGKVSAKKEGETIIRATSKKGKTYKCKVTVKPIGLNKTKLFLKRGQKATLKLNGTPLKGWSSSDTSVAVVNKKGKVTVKDYGYAQIIAESKNGLTYYCEIIVPNIGYKNNVYPDTGNYTKEEKKILRIVEKTLRDAGFYKTTDVMTQEEIDEYGPDAGMGWGSANSITVSNAKEQANSMIEFMKAVGYNMFYFDKMRFSDGEVMFVLYRGTI